MGGAPNQINFQRDLIEKISGGKFDEAIDHSSDFESVALSSLVGDPRDLMVVHNMGQSCRYCTMQADGFNGPSPYLANRSAFSLVSPAAPEKASIIADLVFLHEEGK